MKGFLYLLLLRVPQMFGADATTTQVPVTIAHEKGNFNGQLTVSLKGSMNKAKVEWNATIRNTAAHRIFRVTFCVKAFDSAQEQIKPGGNDCVLTLWGSNWDPGVSLNFKGKQNIRISDATTTVQATKYVVAVTEIFDHSPNLRYLAVRCPLVWSSALKVFADKKFRPTVMDKDSFTVTYAYDGGRIDGFGDAKQMLKAFTNANTAFMGPTWESFRIDAASLYLRDDDLGKCAAEIKMSFAGFGRPFMGALGWYAVESNFSFEKMLLDQLEEQSKRTASADLDRAISQLPTESPKPVDSNIKPQIQITSEPSGAEIEVDGEFIGNTPSTVTAKEGKVVIKVRKSGYQPWERTLTVNSGDKRTLNAELMK